MGNDTMGTCPYGGLWYTCSAQSPTFFGCCLSNPCNGVGCPTHDLLAAGMGTGSGPNAGVNDASYWPNAQCLDGGEWYTCASQTPSFQGCCESKMCNGSGTVCPVGELHPAAFKSVPAVTSSWASATATSSIALASSSRASGPSATSSTSTSKSHTPVGVIVGGSVGGVVGGAIIITLLILAFLWFRNRKSSPELPTHEHTSVSQGDPKPPTFSPEAGNSFVKEQIKEYHPTPHSIDSPQFSPLPPSYRSPSPSSPAIPNHHEIDSSIVYEVESPNIAQEGFVFGRVELPDTPRSSFAPKGKAA